MDNLTELIDRMRPVGKRFVLQIPEGLKTKAVDIVRELEKEFEIYYAADPTYGACDLALEEAKAMGADGLVHVGHSKFYVDIKTDIPVVYFPWKMDVDLDVDISGIKEKKIGLVTTIQHTSVLDDAKKFLEDKGKTVVIGGQILGCWTPAAQKIEDQVDAFLFIGSGHFHPLALKSEKPVYVWNTETREIKRMDFAKMEKKRWGQIYKARDARIFGILVSSKQGQRELTGVAEEIKRQLEKAQKKAIIIVMDEITDIKLQGIRVDAFINTACPRIRDDEFSKPMINASDLKNVIGD